MASKNPGLTPMPGSAEYRTDNDGQTALENAQGLALSKALHGFIVPLIQAAVGLKQTIDIGHNELKFEAANLITVLKDFISAVVRNSASKENTKIEVSLNREEPQALKNYFDLDLDLSHGRENASSPSSNNSDTSEGPQYTVEEKLLEALREHVFNRMPIRLLSFEKNGPNLDIMLLERGAILTRLESRIREVLAQKHPLWDMSEIATKDDDGKISALIFNEAKYAILSHTWLRSSPGEVTYGDWLKGQFSSNDPGYQKLVNFGRVAWTDHRLAFGWMDTVCINKDSSSELDESIRPMFNWYERASVCIIYLAETSTLAEIHCDPWFTRGWTLQELLAPFVVKFYNRNWDRFVEDSISDKPVGYASTTQILSPDIVEQIEMATTITHTELRRIYEIPLSRRMQLAANRKVTREEDMAYSLMGIFSVSISTAYGEGADRAFYRLFQEILNSIPSGNFDLFNWAGESNFNLAFSSIVPKNPQPYLHRTSAASLDLYGFGMRPLKPLTLTTIGLRIPLILMPAMSADKAQSQFKAIGDYSATASIAPINFFSYIPTTYHLLDRRAGGVDGSRGWKTGMFQYTFAIFNIQQGVPGIFIPKTCIAFVLQCDEEVGKVTSTGKCYQIKTTTPVVFDLHMLDSFGVNLVEGELGRHGMQLVNKYL